MLLETEKSKASRWKDKSWVSKKVYDDVESSQSYKKERMDLWLSLDRLYRARHEYYYKNRSNLFVPVVFWSIENIVPRWAGVQQRIIYLPENDATWIPHGPVLTRHWDYQWRRMGDDHSTGQILLIDHLKTALKYGLSIWKIFWERDVR